MVKRPYPEDSLYCLVYYDKFIIKKKKKKQRKKKLKISLKDKSYSITAYSLLSVYNYRYFGLNQFNHGI